MDSSVMTGQEASDLNARLQLLEAELRRRGRATRRVHKLLRWSAAALVGCGLSWSTVALSQTACDGNESSLPAPFITFCPGEVASAFDVNHNFRTLIDGAEAGLDAKLDREGDQPLRITTQTDTSLTADGVLVLGPLDDGNLSFDGNEILARQNGASGDLYLNASANEARTFVQTQGGEVLIGAGGDATRLTVHGNVDVQGALEQDCPSDTTRIGDSCIEKTIREVSDYYAAQSACHASGRHVCSAEEYALCDRVAPSQSDCSLHTDDPSYSMWTSTMAAGNWSLYVWGGASGSADTLSERGAFSTADFYCCEYL